MNKKVLQDIEVSVNTESKAEKGKGTGDKPVDTYEISEVRYDLNSCADVNTVTSDKKMQPCSMKTVIYRHEQKFVHLIGYVPKSASAWWPTQSTTAQVFFIISGF